jgi:hypothetical protein
MDTDKAAKIWKTFEFLRYFPEISNFSLGFIACEFVHFALGSSAGTENDTCVSARIKIFMMTVKLFLITKATSSTILLLTPILKTQNYFATDCTKFPLNFVTYPFLQWKVSCFFFQSLVSLTINLRM